MKKKNSASFKYKVASGPLHFYFNIIKFKSQDKIKHCHLILIKNNKS